MGHQNKRHVQKILTRAGINITEDKDFCGACVERKQHRDSFKSRQQRVTGSGEVIHADLCDPMECASLGGAKYFVCFICDYTRYRMVYFLKEKSETSEKIAKILQTVKNQFGRPVRRFQCDDGREFENKEVSKLLKADGVQLVISNPYTRQSRMGVLKELTEQ